jgi:tRNA(Ile)-lysidine synthase
VFFRSLWVLQAPRPVPLAAFLRAIIQGVNPSRHTLPLDATLLKPGMRLAIAVSGGADSVALLRALVDQNAQKGRELGLVLHIAHLHHGLRGAEADADLAFCRDLAAHLGLPFHHARVDTAAAAEANPKSGKPRETLEEAARRLRYAWFRQLLSEIPLGAVATAHTLDDQAETVLGKFLRGAWTEGLAGISPRLECPEGVILRPLLAVPRAEIEAYLRALGQPWREDSSNRQLSFTRNRIRHELLPLLESWNPQLRTHLAHMASLAHGEEAWWQAELTRLAPQLILPGKPVRGGGRAAGEGLAIECTRLAVLPVALQRRLLRHAALALGARPDFAATESIRALALTGQAGQKLALAQGLRVERTPRELRLTAVPPARDGCTPTEAAPPYNFSIPGEVASAAFGVRLRVEISGAPLASSGTPATAVLRNWKPGDRVRLRYSNGPRKIKEVLAHLRVTGSERSLWPVLELAGQIIWMQGVELEPVPGVEIRASSLAAPDAPPTQGGLPR